MLNIYPVVLEVITATRPLLVHIERRDRDLGRQLRRAISSVALNLAEGMYSRGQLRTARHHTALGSMRESTACLEVAHAFGSLGAAEGGPRTVSRERAARRDLGAIDGELRTKLDQVTGTLVRLVDGPR